MSRNATEEQRAELEDALDAVVPAVDPWTGGGDVDEPVHHPGLGAPNIRPPNWWKGDKAAFRSSTRAMDEIGKAGPATPRRPSTARRPAARGGPGRVR